MQDYTQISPPMEIKAAGHNTLFGIAQGTLLVVVRDTQDVCRTVQLPIVLVPGLERFFFSTAMAAQKVSKLSSLRQPPLLTLACFQFIERGRIIWIILTWLFQKKVNGQSRHVALFWENHLVKRLCYRLQFHKNL